MRDQEQKTKQPTKVTSRAQFRRLEALFTKGAVDPAYFLACTEGVDYATLPERIGNGRKTIKEF